MGWARGCRRASGARSSCRTRRSSCSSWQRCFGKRQCKPLRGQSMRWAFGRRRAPSARSC
eukprot:11568373-Alexandrium_andersonii.AAC.1